MNDRYVFGEYEMKTANRMSAPLSEVDPQVANAIDNEVRRQHEGLELIASGELRQRSSAGSHGLGVHE